MSEVALIHHLSLSL